MTNFKSVANLPLVESAEGLNLIVNDNGAAKQIAASAVGAQADWAETNENSPAFIKNKPTVNSNVEFDVDIKTIYAINEEDPENPFVSTYTVQYLNDFENIKNKFFEAGVLPKAIIKAFVPHPDYPSVYGIMTFIPIETKYMPGIFEGEDAPDAIVFLLGGVDGDHIITLTADGELFYDYPQLSPSTPQVPPT